MKITGQILKENRERKGISISEVAIATKINNKTLLAMESGDSANLPPKTFLRGFVKAYASYLELDVESVMNTYFDEMGSARPKADITETAEVAGPSIRQKPAPNEANDAINPKTSLGVKIGAVAGILLLVILIVVFKNKMERYEKEALDKSLPAGVAALSDSRPSPLPGDNISGTLNGQAPSDDADDTAEATQANGKNNPDSQPALTPTPAVGALAGGIATATSTSTSTPVPSATPGPSPVKATPTPTPTPIPAPAVTPKPTPVPVAAVAPIAAKPATTPSPTPTPVASPSPTPSPTSSPTPVAKPTATPTPRPAGKPQEVIIEALDNVEVDTQVDDEGSKKIKLHSEQVQNIKAKRHVILKFSDGGAVNLIVNGVERGVPGDLGKPMRVELP